MSLLWDRTEGGFFAQKAIDGQPSVNGSPLIMGARTVRFMYRQLTRQTYYESIGEAGEVQRQFLRTLQERELGVRRARLDQILIIVEALQSWYDAPGGAVTLPGPGDPSIGYHCVQLTHYADHGATLGFWNNWGPRWGERGHGTLSYEYLEKYFYEAFVRYQADCRTHVTTRRVRIKRLDFAGAADFRSAPKATSLRDRSDPRRAQPQPAACRGPRTGARQTYGLARV
jgi:hypothetical protein